MLHMIVVYLFVSSPSSLSVDSDINVDLETDAALETDDTTEDPAFVVEQPGKQTRPCSFRYRPFLSLSCLH